MERMRKIVSAVRRGRISPHEADHLLREEHGMTLGHAEHVTMSFDERKRHERHERRIKAVALALLFVFALGSVALLPAQAPTGHAVEQTDMNATPVLDPVPDDEVIPARAFRDEERK